MKKYREVFFYLITLLAFATVIYLVIRQGTRQDAAPAFPATTSQGAFSQFRETWNHNLTHPLAILLLQIITIILTARVFGFICKKLKQPTVIGEIIAGIVLGPSVVGTMFPEFSSFLFPIASLSNLQFLSQIGLILFMFVVGMELDLAVLKNRAKDAVIISHASIIVPFTLGVVLAYTIYARYAPPGISFLSFSLFTGIAMSITAFPVLARIVQEKGLSKTKLGTIAITCAAADDITAWCLLAAVIAIVKAGSMMSAMFTISLAAAYLYVMLALVRPFLKILGDKYANREGLSKPVVAVFFMVMIFSAYITELLGVHALFGAFMAGVIMPANARFRNLFVEKVEDVSMVLLLPLFFVFTGLRTQIGLLDSAVLWQTCGLIVLVAVIGKFFGSAIASRIVGQTWRESLIIGALMNTRGLVELVVLNIGYDLGVLSPEIFAMMVIMALVTTFMTAPALYLINRISAPKMQLQAPSATVENKYNILVSFGSPEKGISLLRLANSMVEGQPADSMITAMHLSPSNEINQYNFLEFEKESFRPIKSEAKKLKLQVNLFFKPSQDIESEIAETANQGNFDLLLVGIGKSVFEGTFLGKLLDVSGRMINPARIFRAVRGREKMFSKKLFDEKVSQIVRSTQVPTGILVDQDLEKIDHVFIPFITDADKVTLPYAERMSHNNRTRITAGNLKGGDPSPELTGLIERKQGSMSLLENSKVDKKLLDTFDLVLISIDSWKLIATGRIRWPRNTTSVLIIRP